MDNLFGNEYVMAAVKVLLIVYAINFAPRLPENVQQLFNSSITKIVGMAAILIVSKYDFQMAILIAIALVVSINLVSGRGFLENYANFVKEQVDNKRLLEPKSVLYPGCMSITTEDLLTAFNRDNIQMQNTVRYVFYDLMRRDLDVDTKSRLLRYAKLAGLPYNLEVNDENAPYIATLLMHYGFKFGETCHAPRD
jgi:hypothetical protein